MKPTRELRDQLKRFALVGRIGDNADQLDHLLRLLSAISYPVGEEIVRKGETGSEAFLLIEGMVEIIDFTMQGEPYVKAVFSDQQAILFGELALVGSEVRTATVRARTPCTCWVLKRLDFLRLGDEQPRLGWLVLLEIVRLVAQRLGAGHLLYQRRKAPVV